jgi:geranylgeranyl pyrophosphate synthase
MGKPKYTDLIKGNLTLPLILLRELPKYKEWLMEVFQEKKFNNSILAKIETAAKDSGITNRSFAIGVSHLDQARAVLQNFNDNQARQFLEDLTYMLQARAN